MELLLTGARITAARAQELGLINRIAPAAGLDAAVAELVLTLAGKSQATLRLGKRAFYTAEDMALPHALEHLAAALSLNVMLEDTAEGVTAFLEKRKPVWKDR